MSAAGTRDDLLSVVTALTEAAATQRKWQAEYEEKAHFTVNRDLQAIEWRRCAAMARGAANAYEVSADMISKYVGTQP